MVSHAMEILTENTGDSLLSTIFNATFDEQDGRVKLILILDLLMIENVSGLVNTSSLSIMGDIIVGI